jgi:predicted Zn-dependent protease
VLVLGALAQTLPEADLDQALEYAKRAYELAPESDAVVDTLAVLQMALNDFKGAGSILEKALVGQPESKILKYRRAELLAKTGRSLEAEQLLQELLDTEEEFPQRKDALALLDRLTGVKPVSE